MGLRDLLYRFYWRAEHWITPGLRSSQYAYSDVLTRIVNHKTRWLDLGCGHQVFGDWMTREQSQIIDSAGLVVGVDLDWNGLVKHPSIHRKIFGDLLRLPVRHGSFNLITANMVVEHVERPEVLLREVYDALSPGGVFVFHTPNLWGWATFLASHTPDWVKVPFVSYLEARGAEDVFRTHYKMNTENSVREAANSCGFEATAIQLVSTSATLPMLGPVVIVELFLIRLLQRPAFANLRSNLVVVLRKPVDAPVGTNA